MKLIVSDRHLEIPELEGSSIQWVDLSHTKITNCVGCYGCWTKTPGKCVIRDDAVRIYPRIAESDHLMYVSKIKYGCYDVPMKTLLERAIPIQQAFNPSSARGNPPCSTKRGPQTSAHYRLWGLFPGGTGCISAADSAER